jgi:hypothetical protein
MIWEYPISTVATSLVGIQGRRTRRSPFLCAGDRGWGRPAPTQTDLNTPQWYRMGPDRRRCVAARGTTIKGTRASPTATTTIPTTSTTISGFEWWLPQTFNPSAKPWRYGARPDASERQRGPVPVACGPASRPAIYKTAPAFVVGVGAHGVRLCQLEAQAGAASYPGGDHVR